MAFQCSDAPPKTESQLLDDDVRRAAQNDRQGTLRGQTSLEGITRTHVNLTSAGDFVQPVLSPATIGLNQQPAEPNSLLYTTLGMTIRLG
jgi:hypothetical protein